MDNRISGLDVIIWTAIILFVIILLIIIRKTNGEKDWVKWIFLVSMILILGIGLIYN